MTNAEEKLYQKEWGTMLQELQEEDQRIRQDEQFLELYLANLDRVKRPRINRKPIASSVPGRALAAK